MENLVIPTPDYTMSPPSKNELARSCKIVQESCMQDLLGKCTRYVPFLARFLHNLAPILARSCKKLCKLAGSYYSCSISCKILHHFLQDTVCARLCKNRARKGTYRMHVPSKSCMQDSCTILHDLASSFLLGRPGQIIGTKCRHLNHFDLCVSHLDHFRYRSVNGNENHLWTCSRVI